MNFIFNWPFALKKDCLDLEAMMLLLGAVLWSEVFLKSAETLHLDEGTSVGIQFCWTLHRVHMCALRLAWMFFFCSTLKKKPQKQQLPPPSNLQSQKSHQGVTKTTFGFNEVAGSTKGEVNYTFVLCIMLKQRTGYQHWPQHRHLA